MGILTNSTLKSQTCIDACNQCAQACYECFQACLNESDVDKRIKCISTLTECAMMCQMSTALMSMNAQSSMQHCQLCSIICDKCAQECDMFKEQHCQKCSEICKKCSIECKNMKM